MAARLLGIFFFFFLLSRLALYHKPNIYIYIYRSAVLGIIILVEFDFTCDLHGLVAIQATWAHFNKSPPWLELIKLHEQTPPSPPPEALRAHKLQTSTTNLYNIIPHPCNSSSCPQARRPTEAAHSFNFSIVTPLVNMSVRFLDPQIFLSITSYLQQDNG